jgi:hypothetical protein
VKDVKNVDGAEVYELGVNQERAKIAIANNPERAALAADCIAISPQRIDVFHEAALKALEMRSDEFEQLLKGL